MLASTQFRRLFAAFGCMLLVATRPAKADAPPPLVAAPATRAPDKPVPLGRTGAPGVEPTALPWHDTYLYWDHAVTANTVGIGRDYQTRNPVYEMTLGLRPRFYFLERPRVSVSARADLGIVTERTNSDVTTQRGEWSLTDFELYGALSYKLRESKEDLTELALRLPRVTLPTSKISYDNGKLLTLGVRVGIREDIALEGRDADFFPNIELIAKAEYGYLFSNSRVPTNGNLERIRLDPEGRSVVSDQLGGATLAQHSAAFGVASLVHVHKKVLWSTALDLRPAWKYPVNQDTQVCGVILTGCATATGVANPTTRSTLTLFSTELWFTFTDVVGLSVGYLNFTQQLGPDGRRRGVFYSPDARFYLTLNVGLDQLYTDVAHGKTQNASAARDTRF